MNVRPLLFILLAWLLASCSRTGTDSDSEEPSREIAPPPARDAASLITAPPADVTSAPADCPAARRAWMLAEGRWQPRCYDAALPRNASLWTATESGAVAAGPTGCGINEPLVLSMLEGTTLTRLETAMTGTLFGRGSVLVRFRGRSFLVNGEDCSEAPRHVILYEQPDDGSEFLRHLGVKGRKLGTLAFTWGEQLLASHYLRSFTGDLDGSGPFGVNLSTDSQCEVLFPVNAAEKEACSAVDPRPERAQAPLRPRIFNSAPFRRDAAAEKGPGRGRPLSWAFDTKRQRLVILGGLEPASDERLESFQELRFTLDTQAWAIPHWGMPRLLPEPPVVGDGVTLLYDPKREQVVLLDPFSDHSYLLTADDRAWEPLEQHAHPEVPDDLRRKADLSRLPPRRDTRLPVTTEELRLVADPELRFTQHTWPYFAFWDALADAAVVIPYSASAPSLCRPLIQDEALEACLKSHP